MRFASVTCAMLMGLRAMADEGHAHGDVAVPDGVPTPTIALDVSADAMTGWNVHIVTEHFAWAPERVNVASDAVEGHAHLYVNGVKLYRVYGPWVHVPPEAAAPGDVIEVTLNANTHGTWSVDGVALTAAVTLEGGPSADHAGMDHGSMDHSAMDHSAMDHGDHTPAPSQ